VTRARTGPKLRPEGAADRRLPYVYVAASEDALVRRAVEHAGARSVSEWARRVLVAAAERELGAPAPDVRDVQLEATEALERLRSAVDEHGRMLADLALRAYGQGRESLVKKK
jgi:hypothetical protein